ncbi:MAG: hypothetical protein LBS31_10590 [Candidatus Adiutrix sp.]|jgi:hypothetical protein|nr:hypothetical protein [Candidatus Adiutrix sp.]
MMNHHFEDFTEGRYRGLLELARRNYRFIGYEDFKSEGRNILWRHDVDMSAHRAFRLAEIEAEAGISATYFILLHSSFYNPLEKTVADLVEGILGLGHRLGLHFDPGFYGLNINDLNGFQEALLMEKNILETVFKKEVRAFSFHDPDTGSWLNFEEDIFAGLINAYGAYFKSRYSYCSDSNGYWRFHRLSDLLEKAAAERLHILTHPAWWVPEAAAPRERVSRAIDGRAAFQHRFYDEFLAAHGRKNIK